MVIVVLLLGSAFSAGAIFERLKAPTPPDIEALVVPDRCSDLDRLVVGESQAAAKTSDLYATAVADVLFGNKVTANAKLPIAHEARRAFEQQNSQLKAALANCIAQLRVIENHQRQVIAELESR